MLGMSPDLQSHTDAEHEAEVARQKDIAESIVEDESSTEQDESVADAAPEPEPVTLQPKAAVENYPLTVSVVGSEDLVFDSADSTVDVPPTVAEQVIYSPAVEVVE